MPPVNHLLAYLIFLLFSNLTTCTSLNGTDRDWPVWSYRSSNANPPFLNITKTGNTEPGYIFTCPSLHVVNGGNPTIYDDDGELIWQGPSGNRTYFRADMLHGEPVLVYWSGMTSSKGYGSGFVRVLNSSYDEIYRVTLPESENIQSPFFREDPASSIDLQDMFVTERGTMLVSAVNATRIDPRRFDFPEQVEWVFDSLFYEIDIVTNEILFRWSALEHPDAVPSLDAFKPVKESGTSQETPYDYIHLNGIAPYGDGYLISMNYMSSLYSIGKDGTVHWRLNGLTGGDFKLGPDTQFAGQHNPRIVKQTPDTLTVSIYNDFKAPNETFISQSTGLELNLDLTAKTVSLNRKVYDPSEPVYSNSQGNYQRLPNGHVFMSRGSYPLLEEYAAEGTCIMRARVGHENYNYGTHTGFRLPWVGTPRSPPSVLACLSHGATMVYASWNGATDVQAWDIWTGNQGVTGEKLEYVATVEKGGFETEVQLEGIHSSVMVKAVGGPNGGGQSDAVRVQQTC